METVVFGMPLSTCLVVTCVPLAITAGLIIWGIRYTPSNDNKDNTQ